MALKHAIRAVTGLAFAVFGTGATLAYFEESIPCLSIRFTQRQWPIIGPKS
jgi:hypothetical protein